MHFKLFPALFDKPQKISFSEQEKGEVIELFLRQHPIVNLPWILISIIATILPAIIIRLDQSLNLNLLINVPTNIIIAALVIYFLLILGYIVEQFLSWYFNVYIVTNRHVVDIDFQSLLYRNVVEIRLNDIESVEAKVSGVLAPIFNYGDVVMDTAATQEAATFLRVPRPDFVADRISDLRFASGPDTDD